MLWLVRSFRRSLSIASMRWFILLVFLWWNIQRLLMLIYHTLWVSAMHLLGLILMRSLRLPTLIMFVFFVVLSLPCWWLPFPLLLFLLQHSLFFHNFSLFKILLFLLNLFSLLFLLQFSDLSQLFDSSIRFHFTSWFGWWTWSATLLAVIVWFVWAFLLTSIAKCFLARLLIVLIPEWLFSLPLAPLRYLFRISLSFGRVPCFEFIQIFLLFLVNSINFLLYSSLLLFSPQFLLGHFLFLLNLLLHHLLF